MLEDIVEPGPELDALVASVRQQANRVIELSPNTPDEAAQVLNSITNPSALADFLAANLQADAAEKQLMLEELDVEKRLRHDRRRAWRRSSMCWNCRTRSSRRSRRTSTRASAATTSRSR